MPSSKGYKRNYKEEYQRYQGSEEQKKNRAARNKARREYEKEHGDVPKNKDIDHKKPLSKWGGNGKGNLRAVDKSKNRSFKRNKDGSVK